MAKMKKLKEKDLPPTDGEWEQHDAGKRWYSMLNGKMHNSLMMLSSLSCLASTKKHQN